MPEFSLDLRDGLLLAAVLVGIYFVMLWLRLARLRKPRPGAAPAVPRRDEPAVPSVAVDSNWGARLLAKASQPPQPAVAEAPAGEGDFGAALYQRNLESQVQRLTEELLTLRAEVDRLQQEVGKANSARNVSPLYGEAVSYAQKGLDAQAIAVRCGISVGEAELVVALARGEPEDRREPTIDKEPS